MKTLLVHFCLVTLAFAAPDDVLVTPSTDHVVDIVNTVPKDLVTTLPVETEHIVTPVVTPVVSHPEVMTPVVREPLVVNPIILESSHLLPYPMMKMRRPIIFNSENLWDDFIIPERLIHRPMWSRLHMREPWIDTSLHRGDYLPFFDRLHTGLLGRETIPVDTMSEQTRFLWLLDTLLGHPDWRKLIVFLDTNTGLLRDDVHHFNLETFIRDHRMLFLDHPFFRGMSFIFPEV